MKNHLTDRQLLDAQFKLCSDAQAEAIAAHLAECPECRSRANALKRKFAALDLLRSDVSASEQLVAETLRQVRNDEPGTARSLLPRFAWPAAAAVAVAVVIVLLCTPQVATPPIQVAMMDKQTEMPAAEVAVQQDVTDKAKVIQEPAARGREESPRKMAFSAETGGAAESIPAPAAVPSDWSASPNDINVQIFPALIEFDTAVRGMKKDSGQRAEQYAISISNTSARHITATLTKTFASTNWSVSVMDTVVQISTQDPTHARLTIDLPASESRTFHCTTILPLETAEGDKP